MTNEKINVTDDNNAKKTSIYDLIIDAWTTTAAMQISRDYQASTTCSDERVFTIENSWSDNQEDKNDEIYNSFANIATYTKRSSRSSLCHSESEKIFLDSLTNARSLISMNIQNLWSICMNEAKSRTRSKELRHQLIIIELLKSIDIQNMSAWTRLSQIAHC